MIKFATHFSIVIFIAIIYLLGPEGGSFSSLFAYILFSVYFIELLFWYLFLDKVLGFKEKIYSLNEDGVEVFFINSNKKKKYKWDNFLAFSKNQYQLGRENVKKFNSKSNDSKSFYLLLDSKYVQPDDVFSNSITLSVNIDKVHQVYEFLKAKLPEKQFLFKFNA